MEFISYKKSILGLREEIGEISKLPVTPLNYLDGNVSPFFELRRYPRKYSIPHSDFKDGYERQREKYLKDYKNRKDSSEIEGVYWNMYRDMFNKNLFEAREFKNGYLKALNENLYQRYFDKAFQCIEVIFGREESKELYDKYKTQFIKTISSILAGNYSGLKGLDSLFTSYSPPIISSNEFKHILIQIFEAEIIVETFHMFEVYSLYTPHENQLPPIKLLPYEEIVDEIVDMDGIILGSTPIPRKLLEGDSYWETAFKMYGARKKYSTFKSVYEKLENSREAYGMERRYSSLSSFTNGKTDYIDKSHHK